LPGGLAGRLIYVSDEDGQDALYERRLPDGPPRRLLSLAEPAREPALSPDGTRVAFVMGGRIALATLATGALDVLTLGVERRDSSPSFSPDGLGLVIASRRSGETNADIQVLSLAREPKQPLRAEVARRALTSTPGLDESEPCFGPDGSFVVFVREDNLVRLQLEGGKQTRLTGGFRKVRHPRFLPAGRLLCLWSADKQYGLDAMDADGKNRETLWSGSTSYRSLAPSPDGRHLLATFEFDLRFHWRDLLRLSATRELRLLDARGLPLGVVARSLRHSYHSAQWGPT
jgi:Tol biopolymer transport system component